MSESKIRELDKARVQSTTGIKNLRRYLRGEKLHLKAAVIAKCCECQCYYEDGTADCKVPECPLYPWMPYRKERTDA